MFAQPRSTWDGLRHGADLRRVARCSRAAKTLTISDTRSRCFASSASDGDVPTVTPAELMRAILMAPVRPALERRHRHLREGEPEGHADAGDRANDAVRVNGAELRARVVGEGGNLGFTQRARIEYARDGGRINTDFIDNSAGVDTSDHEVNIKILLDRPFQNGELADRRSQRTLAEHDATTS